MHLCLLVKLQELIVRLSTLLESLLIDLVCFATVALILILFRPSNVERCPCQSDSLRLHVPINVQGLRAVLCLMTHNTHRGNVIFATFICHNSKISQSWEYYTYKFDPKFNITRVTVIFLFFCESGYNPFQQCRKVALLSSLREGLLCPLYIPVNRHMSGAVHNNAHTVFIYFTYRSQTSRRSSPSYIRNSDSKALLKTKKDKTDIITSLFNEMFNKIYHFPIHVQCFKASPYCLCWLMASCCWLSAWCNAEMALPRRSGWMFSLLSSHSTSPPSAIVEIKNIYSCWKTDKQTQAYELLPALHLIYTDNLVTEYYLCRRLFSYTFQFWNIQEMYHRNMPITCPSYPEDLTVSVYITGSVFFSCILTLLLLIMMIIISHRDWKIIHYLKNKFQISLHPARILKSITDKINNIDYLVTNHLT